MIILHSVKIDEIYLLLLLMPKDNFIYMRFSYVNFKLPVHTVAEIEQQPDANSRYRTESLRNLPVVTRSSFILIELGSLRHGLKYSGAQFLWRWNSVG